MANDKSSFFTTHIFNHQHPDLSRKRFRVGHTKKCNMFYNHGQLIKKVKETFINMWKIHDGNMKKMLNSSSVIRQKDESKNGGYKKTNSLKFFEKLTFLTPWKTRECVGGSKKRQFFGKFRLLCFVTTVLRLALWPYCRRNHP